MAVSAILAALTAGWCCAGDDPPQWAYGTVSSPRARPATPPDNTTAKTLAGSDRTFTRRQIYDAFGPADWFPGDHPAMPDVVAHGRRPDVRACSLCHYPNGKGRPENAPVAGYPVAYFVQQMADFKNGNRKSADPRKFNTNVMIAIAKAMTDEEVKAAAEYFGSMPWTPWIRVVETASVPKTRVAGGLFTVEEGGGEEPLGDRILEVPENTEASETLRNPRSGFIAYAPVGSIRKGETLAQSCGACHGVGLKGLGPVPGIAGRSPSYLMRQMYDMQHGARHGLWTELMLPVVAHLSQDDLLNVAAYAASLKP